MARTRTRCTLSRCAPRVGARASHWHSGFWHQCGSLSDNESAQQPPPPTARPSPQWGATTPLLLYDLGMLSHMRTPEVSHTAALVQLRRRPRADGGVRSPQVQRALRASMSTPAGGASASTARNRASLPPSAPASADRTHRRRGRAHDYLGVPRGDRVGRAHDLVRRPRRVPLGAYA